MRKLIAGQVLFGAGISVLVFAAGMAWYVVPSMSKVPFDLVPPATTIDAHDATFVSPKASGGRTVIAVNHADLETKTGIQPDPGAAADIGGAMTNAAIVWNVYSQTSRVDTGEIINASQSKLAMDRTTGAAVTWSGQCYADQFGEDCAPGNITYTGQVYLFPFDTQKRTYEYFDAALRTALPLTYQDTETVRGLTTYRFTQVIPDRQLKTDNGTISLLLSSLAPKAATGSMWYADTKTLWIEPTTGSIVSYREQQHRTLHNDAAPPVVIFDAALEFSPQTLTDVVDAASHGRSQLVLYGRDVPVGVSLVGLALMVMGFLLSRGARLAPNRATTSTAHPPPDSLSTTDSHDSVGQRWR